MPTALAISGTLAAAAGLALAAAALGAIRARARTMSELRSLAERLRGLEARLARIERAGAAEVGRRDVGDALGGRPKRRRADPAVPTGDVGPTLIAVPELPPAEPAAGPPPAHELGRRFGPIWDLAETGTPAEAIARTTGQPIGQVELILGLRRQVAAAEGRA